MDNVAAWLMSWEVFRECLGMALQMGLHSTVSGLFPCADFERFEDTSGLDRS